MKLPYRMLLRKILTQAPEKQELSSQQPLQCPKNSPSPISTEPSRSVHNETKLLKEENRRLSDKMVLMREKKRQQFHEIETLENKVGQLRKKNKEMN